MHGILITSFSRQSDQMIKSNISNKWDERYHVPWHNALKTDTPGYSDQEKSLNLSLTGVGVCSQSALVAQLCPALCNPMDCSLPGSSVHGILQARILEWVAIFFSRGSSPRRDRTCISCTGRRIPYYWTTWEALELLLLHSKCHPTPKKYSFFNNNKIIFKNRKQRWN